MNKLNMKLFGCALSLGMSVMASDSESASYSGEEIDGGLDFGGLTQPIMCGFDYEGIRQGLLRNLAGVRRVAKEPTSVRVRDDTLTMAPGRRSVIFEALPGRGVTVEHGDDAYHIDTDKSLTLTFAPDGKASARMGQVSDHRVSGHKFPTADQREHDEFLSSELSRAGISGTRQVTHMTIGDHHQSCVRAGSRRCIATQLGDSDSDSQ